MIIVGSAGLDYYGLARNKPKDIDVWYSQGESISIEKGYDYWEMPYDISCIMSKYIVHDKVAHLDALYTIKCSHLQWDIHWEKTKLDIIWMESKGCRIIMELYYALVEVWKKEHGDKSFLSLKKNKDDFFNDNVKYVIDHERMHSLVSYPNEPLFTTVLVDGEDVLTDRIKFDLMSLNDKIKLFREEIVAIAIERWVVHGHADWYEAYSLSLKKVITNLTKGWASDFIIFHLKHFIKPEYSYFKHAIETLIKEEHIMSNDKVDLSVFDDALKTVRRNSNECNYTGPQMDLDSLIFEMAEGDLLDTEKYEAYEHLEQEGGGEGGSEHCSGVFKYKGKIYKAHYSYYSHHGHMFDGIADTLSEVRPVTKTVTVYE